MIAVFETRTSCPYVLLLFVAVPACLARADRVDDYVREQTRLRHIPGLALAVVRDGRVIKESGYGLANVELEAPVTPLTVFEIGSISADHGRRYNDACGGRQVSRSTTASQSILRKALKAGVA